MGFTNCSFTSLHADGKRLGSTGVPATIDRKAILDTYVECLEAVNGQRLVPPN